MRALITGASAGLGRQFAVALAQRGADLVIVARDEPRLNELADELRERHGGVVEVLTADLADRTALAGVEDRLRSDTKVVDLLINNAGFGTNSSFWAGDVATEQAMVDVMVTATMRLTHAAIPGMVARRRGAIVVVSSVAAWITGSTYSAAKAWQMTFAESLAGELGEFGVHVTALAPGYTHTEFHQRGGMDMSQVPDWLWLDASDVVDTAIRDVERGRPVSVPGLQYKAIALAAQYLPRPVIRRITGSRPR